MKRQQMGAIILAGGKSSRMRETKALLPIGGQTLIERVIQNLEPFFEEIIVSAQSPGIFDFLPYKPVIDEKPGQGPIMGILCGLRASRYDINFVTGCDIPDLDYSFLEKMIAYTADYHIVVPVLGEDKFEPLFALYSKGVIPCIERLLGQNRRKVIELFPLCRTKFIAFENSGWYHNLNTLEEYRRYLDIK